MNNALVIFVSTPLIKRDIKIYGVEYYQNNGVEVWFLNFWPLLSKGLSHKADIDFNNQINIDSIGTLLKELWKFKKLKAEFLSDISLNPKTYGLYLILTVFSIDYSFVDNWYAILPKRKNDKIKIAIISLMALLIRKPKFIFRPNHRSFHSKSIAGKKSINIPYASFNFDDFLSNESNDRNNQLLKGKYFVFIDQYLTDLPDFAREGKKSPLTNNYYKSLNRFFNELAIKNGLKYAVASHPRRLTEESIVFDTPDIYFYKTYQLIKDADFVVAHYSNSIYWAVILKKPILFIETQEMKSTFIEKIIHTFASELNQNVYNIDTHDITVNEIKFEIDKYSYEQFKRNHIVYNPITKEKTYEIIFKTLYTNRLNI